MNDRELQIVREVAKILQSDRGFEGMSIHMVKIHLRQKLVLLENNYKGKEIEKALNYMLNGKD